MYQCTSGRHWWTDKVDASRCCDPAWRRILVVLQPGEPPPANLSSLQVIGGALTGRQWVRVTPEDAGAQP